MVFFNVIVGLACTCLHLGCRYKCGASTSDPTIHDVAKAFIFLRLPEHNAKAFGFWIPAFSGMTLLKG